MKIIRAMFILSTLFVLTSCTLNSIPTDKKAYIGEWVGKNKNTKMTLSIESNAFVKYLKKTTTSSESSTKINAFIEEFDGDDIIVSLYVTTAKFVVTSPPKEHNTTWTMVVDGMTLTRAK